MKNLLHNKRTQTFLLFFLFIIIIPIIIFFIGTQNAEKKKNPESEKVTNTVPSQVPAPAQSKWVEGQLLIKFKANVTDAIIQEVLLKYNASIKQTVPAIQLLVITVPKGQEQQLMQELSQNQYVEYVEPDYIATPLFIPNDTHFNLQWGLRNTGQPILNIPGVAGADIKAERAWDVTRGNGITIAVLDSGIDVNHPDFAGKIAGQRAFVTNTINDTYGHGTHVAGIAAAATNNGIGVAGVCPDCRLLIGKVLESNVVGSVSTLAPAITWAADSGAKVIEMSTGIVPIPGTTNSLQDAVNYAWDRNVVIVAAAGNFNTPIRIYPAALDNVVSVAATNNTDQKASFSSYGTWVDIAAPGQNIYSTTPTIRPSGDLSYGFNSGTSMATPMTAGTAALIWASPYGTSNRAVVERLLATADRIPGTGQYWIAGRVNAAAAVGATGNPSIIPTFACVGGSAQAPCATIPPNGTPAPTIPVGSTITPGNPANPCEILGTATEKTNTLTSSNSDQYSGGGFFKELFELLLKLIELIINYLEGNHTNPGTPQPTAVPQPSIIPTPCPTAEPTLMLQPTSQPTHSITSTPEPTIAITPIFTPTMAIPTQEPTSVIPTQTPTNTITVIPTSGEAPTITPTGVPCIDSQVSSDTVAANENDSEESLSFFARILELLMKLIELLLERLGYQPPGKNPIPCP